MFTELYIDALLVESVLADLLWDARAGGYRASGGHNVGPGGERGNFESDIPSAVGIGDDSCSD